MTVETAEALIERIRDALRLVIDPELGYNIVDLGLIYDIAVQTGDAVNIIMTTTTRGCPATDYLRTGAQLSAATVAGNKTVDVELVYDPPWTPHMMSPEAKTFLGITDGGGW